MRLAKRARSRTLTGSRILCTVLLVLATTAVYACGAKNGTANTQPTAGRLTELAYQKLLSAFRAYDIEKAFVSVALQDGGTATDRADLENLDEDATKLRTTLDMCYEFAHRPNNFPRDRLGANLDELIELARKQKSELPFWSGRTEKLPHQDEYVAARTTFLSELESFAATARSEHTDKK